MDQLLHAQDLRVSYRSRDQAWTPVLRDVSFEMFVGESIGILGESGCGKSTLALTLLNLLPASAHVFKGSVVFRGANLLTLSEKGLRKFRGAQISMIHQEPGAALNPVLGVGQQVSEVLRAHQSISRQRSLEEAKNLLLQVGFAPESDIWKAYPHQLSGGQQQRVAIAQAIACRPSLLIADEPTTALDPAAQEDILRLLARLRGQFALGIILISHDPAQLAGFADRILVMYAGQVVEEGPAWQVLNQPLHPYTRALMRCRPEAMTREKHRQKLPVIPGDCPDFGRLPVGCTFEDRCLDRMAMCRTREPGRFRAETDRVVTCFRYVP